MSSEEFDPYLDTPVWGDKAFGKVINTTAKKAEHLRRAGELDVDQIGERLYASTPRRLLRRFVGKPEAAR